MRAKTKVRYILAMLVASLLMVFATPSGAKLCREVFGELGQETSRFVQDTYQSFGIQRSAQGGFTIRGAKGTREAATLSELVALLRDNLNGASPEGSIALYFQDLNAQEAANLISTLRLKGTSNGPEIEGFVQGSGGNGGGPPPSQPNAAAESPSGGGNGGRPSSGGSVGGGQVRLMPPAFKPLSRRYDWGKAAVETLSEATAPLLSRDFDSGYSFRIVIPPAKDEAPTKFRFSVFFRKLTHKPSVEDVGNTVRATLKEEELQQATVQRAARRVINRVKEQYPNSDASFDLRDLIIVELQPASKG